MLQGECGAKTWNRRQTMPICLRQQTAMTINKPAMESWLICSQGAGEIGSNDVCTTLSRKKMRMFSFGVSLIAYWSIFQVARHFQREPTILFVASRFLRQLSILLDIPDIWLYTLAFEWSSCDKKWLLGVVPTLSYRNAAADFWRHRLMIVMPALFHLITFTHNFSIT